MRKELLSIYIDFLNKKKLEKIAKKEKRSISYLIRELIIKFINNKEKQNV